jgi:hypothetical protein
MSPNHEPMHHVIDFAQLSRCLNVPVRDLKRQLGKARHAIREFFCYGQKRACFPILLIAAAEVAIELLVTTRGEAEAQQIISRVLKKTRVVGDASRRAA